MTGPADFAPADTGRYHADLDLADRAQEMAGNCRMGLAAKDVQDDARAYLLARAERLEQHARKLREAAQKHGETR